MRFGAQSSSAQGDSVVFIKVDFGLLVISISNCSIVFPFQFQRICIIGYPVFLFTFSFNRLLKYIRIQWSTLAQNIIVKLWMRVVGKGSWKEREVGKF